MESGGFSEFGEEGQGAGRPGEGGGGPLGHPLHRPQRPGGGQPAAGPGDLVRHARPVRAGGGDLGAQPERRGEQRVRARIIGNVHGERMSHCIIGIRLQVEAPGRGVWPVTAPPIAQDLLRACIPVQIAVVDESPELHFLALQFTHRLAVPGKAVLADGGGSRVATCLFLTACHKDGDNQQN